MEFQGRHDTFEVVCTGCHGEIVKERVTGFLSGYTVECSGCGATATASEDGGIWKLYGGGGCLEMDVV